MPIKYAGASARQIESLGKREDVVAVLPVGSVEQHCGGPVGLDAMIAEALAERACKILESKGLGLCLVLPPLSYGHSPEWEGVAGTISLDAETFLRLIKSILSSLMRAGFRRIALLNGHGGNAGLLEAAARELSEGVAIMVLNYWEAAGIRLDHAGPAEIAVARSLGIDTNWEDCEGVVLHAGKPRIVMGRVKGPAKMVLEGSGPQVSVEEAVAEALARLIATREGTLL